MAALYGMARWYGINNHRQHENKIMVMAAASMAKIVRKAYGVKSGRKASSSSKCNGEK